ncbi:hypothetical protein F4778DRAFT_746711 [Xylariomycetidae sp. FL2044]|nr:hypothetical protein F4778DRAFT_746711 [Xylariomycetidae sp. FL2044]
MDQRDIACSRCRERKTRCSRERPACSSCKSDSSECDYSLPEKRVNHLKLLCSNFDRLENRLNSIESDLSWLTAALKHNGAQQLIANSGTGENPDHNVTETDDPGITRRVIGCYPSKGRIMRGQDGTGGLSRGPGTLLSLCQELQDFVLSEESNPEPHQAVAHEPVSSGRNSTQSMLADGRCAELLERICIIASFDTPLEAPEQSRTVIKLPPKQLLLLALPQFFSQIDYTTDIFVETRLVAQVEVIYSQPQIPVNDAWAICFNTIILLVMGSESWSRGNDRLMVSQFAQPLFQAMRTALHQARFLTTPDLINVQALALLSVAAERYYPAETSMAMFAQACLLSRRAGLHQMHAELDDFSRQEVQERFKTFVSLFVRDKTLALTSSSLCWLSSFDHSPSLHVIPPIFVDACNGARVQLAKIQEELYRYLSLGLQYQSGREDKQIASIHRKLNSWRSIYAQYLPLSTSYHRVELQLTFLATRLIAYNGRIDDEAHRCVVLDDARASCFILLKSCDRYDRVKLDLLQSLLRRQRSTSGILTAKHDANSDNKSSSTGRLTSLFNAFPLVAFFELSKHVMRLQQHAHDPPTTDADDEAKADLELLEGVHSCAVEVSSSRTETKSHVIQVERILGHVLELVKLSARGGGGPDSNDGATAAAQDLSALGFQGGTPDTSSRGLGSEDFSVAATLAGTDLSWDFLSSPTPDTLLSLGGQAAGGEEGRRKRPRMSDVDFTMGNDFSFPLVPIDWPNVPT